MMKVYLDHTIIGLLYEIKRGKLSGGPKGKEADAKAIKSLLNTKFLQFFVSEDSASEVEKTSKPGGSFQKEAFIKILSAFSFASTQHRIRYGDKYRFGHGVTLGGPYPDIKDKIKKLLEELSGCSSEYDARELANCYKTDIKYFLTIDERTILIYRDAIKRKFGINILKPSGLVKELNSNQNLSRDPFRL